jgi:hypothetical protein
VDRLTACHRLIWHCILSTQERNNTLRHVHRLPVTRQCLHTLDVANVAEGPCVCSTFEFEIWVKGDEAVSVEVFRWDKGGVGQKAECGDVHVGDECLSVREMESLFSAI